MEHIIEGVFPGRVGFGDLPNKRHFDESIEFLKKRIKDRGDKPNVQLKRIFPNAGFRRSDVAAQAGFKSFYTSRLYGTWGNLYATEITSMGMESLYLDPIKFVKDDPEFFVWLMGVLRSK